MEHKTPGTAFALIDPSTGSGKALDDVQTRPWNALGPTKFAEIGGEQSLV
jgi:hypothetical protein